MADWFLYLIRTHQGNLYTGITTDIRRRLLEHQDSAQRGAKYLRAKGPLQLVYERLVGSRSLAAKAEYRLKGLSKAQKERIVAIQPDRAALFTLLGVTDDD